MFRLFRHRVVFISLYKVQLFFKFLIVKTTKVLSVLNICISSMCLKVYFTVGKMEVCINFFYVKIITKIVLCTTYHCIF